MTRYLLRSPLALPCATFVPTLWSWLRADGGRGHYDTFREAGLWIRDHSLPEERIAYGEIGNLAYWSRRPLDDLLGLVTPESIPYVLAGDGVGAFLRRPPELSVDHPANPQPGIATRPWFVAGYQPVAGIEPPNGVGPPATVYRKRPGAELPPPRGPYRPRAPKRPGGG